jgi:hypothetical protein
LLEPGRRRSLEDAGSRPHARHQTLRAQPRSLGPPVSSSAPDGIHRIFKSYPCLVDARMQRLWSVTWTTTEPCPLPLTAVEPDGRATAGSARPQVCERDLGPPSWGSPLRALVRAFLAVLRTCSEPTSALRQCRPERGVSNTPATDRLRRWRSSRSGCRCRAASERGQLIAQPSWFCVGVWPERAAAVTSARARTT